MGLERIQEDSEQDVLDDACCSSQASRELFDALLSSPPSSPSALLLLVLRGQVCQSWEEVGEVIPQLWVERR